MKKQLLLETMAYTKFLVYTILAILFFSTFPFQTESTNLVPLRRSMKSNPRATAAQLLSAHNRVRAKHNLPPLKWNPRLATYAKWYANKRRMDCALVHSTSDYGENIFWGEGGRWKATDAVAAWAVQEAYYDYKHNTCMPNKECLHYTQLVWRDTKQVGCAMIKCKSGDTFVLCEYYPPGNVIGERPY